MKIQNEIFLKKKKKGKKYSQKKTITRDIYIQLQIFPRKTHGEMHKLKIFEKVE